MAAQDRDDLLRLLATVRAIEPHDRAAALIQTQITRKLQSYLQPGWLGPFPGTPGATGTPGVPGGGGSFRTSMRAGYL